MTPTLPPADEFARQLAYASPAGFAHVASGGAWLPARHLLLIAEKLCAVARGEIDRLMVFMPPRSGKSELISKYTPAWFLGTQPHKRVMVASYGAALASEWGRKARDILEEWGPALFGVTIRSDSKAADRWEIADQGGGMVTAGVGGPLTGKGGDLIIIDDPLKDAESAASETIRAKQIDWWRSTVRTRLMPGGAVVLLQTRWHQDDLAGWLLGDMAEGGDQWEVLSLPALADSDEDPLGRTPGDALWPEMFDVETLLKTKRALGTYYWSAMYQQQPRPAEGMLFKQDDFRYWEPHGDEPGLMVLHRGPGEVTTQSLEHCTLFETVDVAASEKQTADYTVICKWAVTPERDLILVDRRRRQFEILDVGGFVRETHLSGELTSLPAATWTGWEAPRALFTDVESFGHGLTVVQELIPQGLPIRKIQPHTDKVSRALVAVARYEEHKVFHPRLAPWRREFEDEMLAFPLGANDDQVDTVSMAALRLADIQVGPPRKQREPRGRTAMGGVRSKAL